MVKIGGHNFMGIIDVLAPVYSETPAITTSITPDILYTSIDEKFSIYSNAVIRMTKSPMKIKRVPLKSIP
jgi:hypothetical protein